VSELTHGGVVSIIAEWYGAYTESEHYDASADEDMVRVLDWILGVSSDGL